MATNTSHWKDFVFGKASAICFLADTRLKFWMGGKCDDKGAPMACAMICWGADVSRFVRVLGKFGAALDTRPLKELFAGKEHSLLLATPEIAFAKCWSRPKLEVAVPLRTSDQNAKARKCPRYGDGFRAINVVLGDSLSRMS